MGSQVERSQGKVVAVRLAWARQQLVDSARRQLADRVVPHLHADKLGGTSGEQDSPYNPGFQRKKRKPQNLCL